MNNLSFAANHTHAQTSRRRQKCEPQEPQQTFTLTMSNGLDAWLLITLTGWAGTTLDVSNYMPWEPTELRMQFRKGTFGLAELRVLVGDILQFEEALRSLRCSRDVESKQPCSSELLAELARHAHCYLDAFDVVALVRDTHGFDMRTKLDVVGRVIPSPETDHLGLIAHLRLCVACFRLTYLHEEGYRAT